MSTTVDTPTVLTELNAEALPLPESRPDSPTKIDDAATTSPVTSIQADMIHSVIVPPPKTDDDASAVGPDGTKSDADSAIGSNKSNCGTSCESATLADAECDEVAQDATDKSEPEPINPEAANDLSTATSAESSESSKHVTDAVASRFDTGPKAEVDVVKNEDTLPDRNEQVVNSPDAKLIDPNDTENMGNVVRNFFTSEVEARWRCLSTIHEHGNVNLKFSDMADLFVKVNDADGRVYVFQVHSATLEAASTVFYDMVYTSNTRGNKEAWVWVLQDSVIGLKVMFSLLHLNYPAALFTQEPSSHQVYEILRVLAKYGIRDEAIHPFVKSWVAGFRKGLDHTELTHLERLYTAHKLGDFKTLKISIRKVAHEVEISEDGSVLHDKEPIQDVVPITDELVANIRAVRGMDLKNILDPLKTAYESLMGDNNDQDPANFCKSLDGHDECNEKLLGSLLGNLRRQKLRPIPAASTYTGSVGVLAEKVSQMDIRGLIVPNLEPHRQRHGRCKLGQDDVAKQLLDCKSYLSIYDDLVEQMVVTIKRAGTNKDEKNEFEDYKDVFNKASISYDEASHQDFWGWDEGTKSTGSEQLFPQDTSSIGENSDFKERKISLELAASGTGDV